MTRDTTDAPDVAKLIRRAIAMHARATGIVATVETIETRPWASATFCGERHRMTIESPAIPDPRQWIGMLPEADLPIRGHIVADLSIERIDSDAGYCRAVVEALTLIAA